MTPIKVLIADDHPIVREGVALIINSQAEFQVVAQVADGQAAIACLSQHQPDIALLDVTMPGLSGIAVAKIIQQTYPKIKVLILTMHNDDEIFFAAIKAGASGYILKGAHATDLIEALQIVMNGDVYLSPAMTRKLVNNYLDDSRKEPSNRLQTLTPRETEVTRLLAQGLTNREIAGKLVISPSTVQTHRTHIMEKLSLNNRTDLVRYAIRHNLVKA